MIGGSWFALTLVSFDQVDLTAVADEHLPSPLSLVLTLLLRIEPDELPDCSTPQADATNLDMILSRRSKYGIMARMTTPLRIVFMGTPEFAVPSLQALLEADPEKIGRVVGVVTQQIGKHTSELQSRLHLVCRLLLEKKKKNRNRTGNSHA